MLLFVIHVRKIAAMRGNALLGFRRIHHRNRWSLTFLLKKLGFEVRFIKAPIRKLAFMEPYAPQIGGQIVCLAQVTESQS